MTHQKENSRAPRSGTQGFRFAHGFERTLQYDEKLKVVTQNFFHVVAAINESKTEGTNIVAKEVKDSRALSHLSQKSN